MFIIKVNSEWELGIPDYYTNILLAQQVVAEALEDAGFEGDLDYYRDGGLISFESVWVAGD